MVQLVPTHQRLWGPLTSGGVPKSKRSLTRRRAVPFRAWLRANSSSAATNSTAVRCRERRAAIWAELKNAMQTNTCECNYYAAQF